MDNTPRLYLNKTNDYMIKQLQKAIDELEKIPEF